MAAPMLSGKAMEDRILEVAEVEISRKQVKDVLDSLAYVVQEAISEGNRARIPGIGTLEVRMRRGIKKGTMVRNPATGENVKHAGKPASTKVGFRPIKPLVEALPTPQKAKRALAR